MGKLARPFTIHVTWIMVSLCLAGCTSTKLHSQSQEVPKELKSNPISSPFTKGTAQPESYFDPSIVETQQRYTGPRRLKIKETETQASASSSHKTAYLTFDDGPSGSTKKILSILKSFQIPATFFVVGSDTSEGRSLYKQIVAEGHALGNHTYSHDYNRIYKSPEAFMKDVHKLDQLLEQTVGYHPDILRFPGGVNNHLSWKSGGKGIMTPIARVVKEEGYQYFDWNVSSTDAAAPVQDRDMIIDAVVSASRGKQSIIVLMHDNTFKTTTVEALPIVIQKLQAAGFHFEKLTKSSFTFQFLKP
ncbi:polysaccharide deacetylase family protein [Paenibacillus sp. N3.4]|uniref:polysaccharide deacetylase family protein n=1 Tax=Paenibacillus sp. N3.4 TaxID=2603222 RepID=UPI00164F4801|nr:polysaccharide deacetylase family protein [Paenibacillus sp. N3.4]